MITMSEFELLTRPKSRWTGLVERLVTGEEIVMLRIPQRENDSHGRQRIRHQIHAYAKSKGLRVQIRSKGKATLFVRLAPETEG